MYTVEITAAEFKKLRQFQRKRRWDWPAVFSTNRLGEIWAPPGKGWTGFENRVHVRDAPIVLQRVVDKYQIVRSELGRIFIDENGASYFDNRLKQKKPFVEFIWIRTKIELPHRPRIRVVYKPERDQT